MLVNEESLKFLVCKTIRNLITTYSYLFNCIKT
jgi:hypothetical protein